VVKQGGRQVSQKACRQEEAEVGTERLGDRQPDRWECISRSRQIKVGKRSGMQAIIDAGMWAG
jgi:hypothetical protein